MKIAPFALERYFAQYEFSARYLLSSSDCDGLRQLIVINFPHNPTGFLPSAAAYEQIVTLAGERNIILFADEMYRFLEYDPGHRLPSASDLYENAISLFGMSKTFGLAGLRI